ncbi:MAG: TlpA disulfide reductase family protein [Steroidobacter sp.]
MTEPRAGVYRATLALPGGDAPFGLEIAREKERWVLYLSNGAERTRVTNVRLEGSALLAVFPGYENSLRATMAKEKLEGAVTLIKAGGKEQVIPFKATLGETHRFYKDVQSDNADVAGRWEATFINDAGEASKAVALLKQEHDRVTGTVMTPTGDHRYLEGQVRGDELQLSTFAGGLAYLYKFKVNAAGELEGDYWQGLAWREKVTARRNAEAALEGAGRQTTMKDDAKRLDFTFNDVEGNPVSLSDERFRGKVVLVTLGGTWCPNCHDETMFLAPFYREYRDKGFEVIALMFERHAEFEKAARAVRGYRDDLGINFTTLIAGTADDEAGKALPSLSGIYGYPTTILIDRKGEVRDIHTGFSGPATGAAYDEFVTGFRAQVDELLAEPEASG